MTDEQLGIVLKVALLAAVGAFAPQIYRLARRFGYREEGEVETTGWKRGAKLIGGTVVAVLGLVFLTALF